MYWQFPFQQWHRRQNLTFPAPWNRLDKFEIVFGYGFGNFTQKKLFWTSMLGKGVDFSKMSKCPHSFYFWHFSIYLNIFKYIIKHDIFEEKIYHDISILHFLIKFDISWWHCGKCSNNWTTYRGILINVSSILLALIDFYVKGYLLFSLFLWFAIISTGFCNQFCNLL